jgi:aspartate/methionine/tyrosine aminotransferase
MLFILVRKSILNFRIIYLNLAQKHSLFIIADEVYQENVYLPDSKFFSFKSVLMNLGSPYNQMEMGIIFTKYLIIV